MADCVGAVWNLLLILSLAALPDVPRGVHDDGPLPRAWALLGAEVLWVCWDADAHAEGHAGGCFVPVTVEAGVGNVVELRFVDRSRLELGLADGSVLSVTRGQGAAEPVDDPGATALLSPRALACAPGGRAPRWSARGPTWIRCTPNRHCEPLRIQPRGRPTGLQIGLTLSLGRRWATERATGRTSNGDWTAGVSMALAFSGRARDRDMRLRASTRQAVAARASCAGIQP